MGLPNLGHAAVAKKISQIQKINKCPIGASIAEDPNTIDEIKRIDEVIEGIILYEKAGADFIEINFSCPNVTEHHTKSDNNSIHLIYEKYIKKRSNFIPIIAKYSNDIQPDTITNTIDLLIDSGFSGINLGNTSTKYDQYLPLIDKKDTNNYHTFTKTFGGGLSGDILKQNSLSICTLASKYIKTKTLSKEFHCIRTGGISTKNDIISSQNEGIPINQ